MKVKDVLSLAAANLGRVDLCAQLCDLAGEPQGELLSLLRCYNLVENEVALDYFPLKREEEISATDGIVPYADLTFAPVNVLRVTDGAGAPVPFETTPSCVRVPRRGECALKVLYSYSPKEKGAEEDSEFTGKISSRLLSFGVACEFCLTNGQYQEAATWEKKYREALRAANILRKKLSVRTRRWA